MKAWTVRQPYASLIVMGAVSHWHSPAELPSGLIGEEVAVFAHGDRVDPVDIRRLYIALAMDRGVGTSIHPDIGGRLVERCYIDVIEERAISPVRLGCIVGTVRLGRAVKLTDLYPDDAEISPHLWAWPLSEPSEYPRARTGRPPAAEFWEWNP